MNLLTRGNGKLGEAIHGWSLPPVETCPGASELCRKKCYGRRGNFAWPLVKARHRRNLEASLQDDFDKSMRQEIRRRRVTICRPHIVGDFYDQDYVEKWFTIACGCPGTKFYAYTRSWRVEGMADSLRDLGRLRNFRLWYSADAETGMPPEGSRVAWMASRGDEKPPAGVGLVFRVHGLRNDPVRRMGLSMVCPTETGLPGSKDVTCTSCGKCFDGPVENPVRENLVDELMRRCFK